MGLCLSHCRKPDEARDYEAVQSYTGETKLGLRHGKGLYLFPNGDMYDGEWRWGKKHGYGTYTRSDQSELIGHFFDDEYIGKDPGNLFAEEPIKEAFPAQPLSPQQHDVRKKKPTPEEEYNTRQREEERALKREERRKRRDQLRSKYNL